MKIHLTNVIILLITLWLTLCNNAIQAQIVFSAEKLTINEVTWICQDNVVVEDFATGPRFDMIFSISNIGADTLRIPRREIKITMHSTFKHIEKSISHHKSLFEILFNTSDTLIMLPPNSKSEFSGWVRLNMIDYGETSINLNYRKVDFMSCIASMLKSTTFIIELPGNTTIEAPVKNCHIGRNFFVDKTYGDSIIPD